MLPAHLPIDDLSSDRQGLDESESNTGFTLQNNATSGLELRMEYLTRLRLSMLKTKKGYSITGFRKLNLLIERFFPLLNV